jgi:hypothetical protein
MYAQDNNLGALTYFSLTNLEDENTVQMGGGGLYSP